MRLFIGNIQFDTTDSQLKAHFEQCGKVTRASVSYDRVTNKPKGFGFVDMPDRDAQDAIDNLNGVELFGRELVVEQAKERPRFESRPDTRSRH